MFSPLNGMVAAWQNSIIFRPESAQLKNRIFGCALVSACAKPELFENIVN